MSYPEHLRELVEEHLDGLRFTGEGAIAGLQQAMRYSLLAGGKRVRPVLALATARAVGADPRSVLPLAAEAGAELDSLLRSGEAGSAPAPGQLALDS